MHVIVTGASSGIGAALARELHRGGASVTLVARRRPLLLALARELGDRCRTVVHDLAEEAPDGSAPTWLVEALGSGPVDVLVNNAGTQAAGPFARSDPAVARALVRVDLLAPIAIARAVVPVMLTRGQGVVVNVASLAALAPPPGMAWYAGAKAGLAAFSESLGAELRGSGVHVLTVYPGPIDNGAPQPTYELYGNSGAVARLPVGSADGLARAIRRAIEQRRRRLIYPRIYGVVWWANPLARWIVARAAPPLRDPAVTGASA